MGGYTSSKLNQKSMRHKHYNSKKKVKIYSSLKDVKKYRDDKYTNNYNSFNLLTDEKNDRKEIKKDLTTEQLIEYLKMNLSIQNFDNSESPSDDLNEKYSESLKRLKYGKYSNNRNFYYERLARRKSISSYGTINFTIFKVEDKINVYYLVGKRRDSIAYAEFVKDHLEEKEIKRYIKLMSLKERRRLLEYKDKPEEIWKDLVLNTKVNCAKYKAINSLKERIEKYQEDLILVDGNEDNSWGFPKGRKFVSETELDCAVRETCEETLIHQEHINIISRTPYEEIYLGSDYQLYRNVYFLSYVDYQLYPVFINSRIDSSIRANTLSEEIEELRWMNYNDALECLDDAKKIILADVNTLILGELIENTEEQVNNLKLNESPKGNINRRVCSDNNENDSNNNDSNLLSKYY